MISKSVIFCFFLLVFLILTSLSFYCFSPSSTNESQLVITMALFVVSVFVFFHLRAVVGIKAKPLSLGVLFLLAYTIVFFQFPIDFYLGSYSDNSVYKTLVFDDSVFFKSVWYALIFFLFICLGMAFQAVKLKKVEASFFAKRAMPEKLFFLLFYLFLFLHLITVDAGYYGGSRTGDLQGLAGSVLGYFILLLPVCVGVVIYNYKISSPSGRLGFIGYINLFPTKFIVVVLVFSLMTFAVGDRGPAIRALILFVVGYFVAAERSVSYFLFISVIVIAGVFLSTIKAMGVVGYQGDIIGSFFDAYERLTLSNKFSSIFPATAELSASFRSYNTAFSLWESGYSLYGLGVLAGVLMSIPYAVSVLMQLFSLEKVDISVAHMVTSHSGESYGLGNSIVGDALLNVGFIFSLLIAFFMGRFFLKIDFGFYVRPGNVYWHVLGFYFLMSSLSLARGSIFPALGNSLMLCFIVFFVSFISRKISKWF